MLRRTRVEDIREHRDEYVIESESEHYCCVGEANLLGEEDELVRQMPGEPDSYVLRALFNVCGIYGDVELGEKMINRLAREELDHSVALKHIRDYGK
ncbi:hypothetical protein V2J09_009195 [Rumex salicifolius]